MIRISVKSLVVAMLLSFSANAFADDYLCTFENNGPPHLDDYGFEGERIFSDDLPDVVPLPCGTVDREFTKLASSSSLPHDQLSATWGTDGSLTIPNGNFAVTISKVSKNDGQDCTTRMDIITRGTTLYSGAPLSNFSVSIVGEDTSSYVSDKYWFLNANGDYQAAINELALISPFDGTSSFS
jgi:hypothetical protein